MGSKINDGKSKSQRYRERHREKYLARKKELRAARTAEQIERDKAAGRERWQRVKDNAAIKRKEHRKTEEYKTWYREYMKRYRKRCAELAKKRYHANPPPKKKLSSEQIRINNQRALAKHPNKQREASMKWYRKTMATNPSLIREKAIAAGHKRRAQKRNTGGKFTAKDIENLFIRQGGKCATCKVEMSSKSGPDKFHVDHVTPLAKGGSNGIENIALLCRKCNTRKYTKDPDEWARQNGLLFF